jgi:rSAM/selenodomain-associated transferase 1
MARAPSAGGKTRLARDLSSARLTTLRAALLADTLDLVQRAAATRAIDPVVFYTPADAGPEIGAASDCRFPHVSQSDGDLGDRMRSALAHLLDDLGYGSAMLVGTDIPLLTAAHLSEARQALESTGGIVLGPADDGGYVLIGMTKVHAALFEGIEWGSAGVLTDTLRAAERHGIKAHLVAGSYDVDTIEDLRRLERDLASAAPDVAPHVRAWFGAR